VAATATSLRVGFFEYLFGDDQGYLCVARGTGKLDFKEQYFSWPAEKDALTDYVNDWVEKKNLWFCTSLLKEKKRSKPNCLPGSVVWADLDFVVPETVTPTPSCVLETSPDKYQAFWRLDAKLPADVIEDYAKRITYSSGADKGGWGLTKMMRVPYTLNHKYINTKPEIKIKNIHETPVPIELFESISAPQGAASLNGDSDAFEDVVINDVPMPNVDELPAPEQVIYAHRQKLIHDKSFAVLMGTEPSANESWSHKLWRLINVCFEAGMSDEETFSIALAAKCNKYERDNRPINYLWRDVLKASARQSALGKLIITAGIKPLEMPQLVDPDTITVDSFLADYNKWATHATDAPVQYHDLCAFIALSAVVCQGLRLETTFGPLRPHLWALVLGESTLTRKTTSMNLAKDILLELDDELIVGTEGSAEGLLTALQNRPRRVSMFFKDEVSGLFDSMNKKDYLAGLAETFTQLYDAPKIMHRVLRKEKITIAEPYFIFFGGGIRDRVYSLVNEEYVVSGFLPRFLVVSGVNDLSSIRPTGPPTDLSIGLKNKVIESLSNLKEVYTQEAPVQVGSSKMYMPVTVDAKLTPEAWKLNAEFERKLAQAGENAYNQLTALPTMIRLGFSTLKMAMLVAATRREATSSNTLEVNVDDLRQAAFYTQQWGAYSIDLVNNAGKPSSEKIIDRIYLFIKDHPEVLRSVIMQRFRLGGKEMREVMDTLVGRGLVHATNTSNGGIKLRSTE
jgi:hypothetical protein